MSEIIVQKFGAAPNLVAAEATHEFINDGRTKIYVSNFSGGDVVITFIEQNQCDFEHAAVNDAFTCASGGITRVWLALNRYRYNDSAGKAHLTLDIITSVTVAAISETPVGV